MLYWNSSLQRPLKGTLSEDATSHQAVIDFAELRAVAAAEDVSGPKKRPEDPRMYDFVIQVTDVGAATSVDFEVMGPGGLWSSWATGKTVGQCVVFDQGWWRAIRLTWSGGAPDGTGFQSPRDDAVG